MFCINTAVVIFMCLEKENKIKPVEENFQNKILEYFIWGVCPFQICNYADIITIIAKTFTKGKK